MQRVEIQEATADQLRQFAAVFLGLEVEGRETREMMKGKLAEAGYGLPFIQLPETVAPSAAPARSGSTREGPNGTTQVRITVHAQDKPGGDEPVFVSVNGVAMWIPRGEPVWVPQQYVEALENAVEAIYEEYDPDKDAGLGGLHEPRRVKSYPFSYA